MTTSLHHSYMFLIVSLVVISMMKFRPTISTDGNVLSSTKSFTLTSNRTMMSPGAVFELGLFKTEPTSPDWDQHQWYLGIWFKKVPKTARIYLWVANRDNPLSIPMGTLRISKCNIILFDQSNTRVWSTNVTDKIDMTPLVADILNDGNFVLRSSNNSDPNKILWQSFDFPTDIVLPNMKLGWMSRRGHNSILRSWKSSDNPSTGDFSYGFDIAGQSPEFPAMFIWEKKSRITRITPWNGATVVGGPKDNPSSFLMVKLIAKSEEVTFSFSVHSSQSSDRKFISILRLTSRGQLEHLMWMDENRIWNRLWVLTPYLCELYNFCGPNSYCEEIIVSRPVCTCIRGFEPKNRQAWALGKWGEGCVRKTQLSCNDDSFLPLINIQWPDNAIVVGANGFNECEQICVVDCKCTAFAVTSRDVCVIWTAELLDVRKNIHNGGVVYVRIHETEKKTKTKLIAWLSIGIGFILFLSAIACYYWRKKKKRARAATPINEHLPGEIIMENLELPLIGFEDISLATNDFSDSNKLGSGGFGVVYKGILDGQMIAVKRLSPEISGQGVNEFKNELMLITKVKHINLVSLSGYCVNRDEKLLIYEYLENRSLDLYLFDETKRSELNWPRRLEIATGIARGLSCLHCDAPTMIIHRDLKPSNILLDKEMTPKISDFGMARIFNRGQNEVNTSRVVGTYGYMAPEYSQDGTYSAKSDVYSFGVLMLEMITGKRNRGFSESNNGINLLQYVFNKWNEGEWADVIDPIVISSSHEVKRCIEIGLLCVQGRPEDRPIMQSVVVMLVSQTEQIPQPNPPIWYYVDGKVTDSVASSSIAGASTIVIEPR